MNQEQKARKIILVTGAARSGKSEWAETLATETGKPVIYVATARVDASDSGWTERIEKHRLRRPDSWQTLVVPEQLPVTIETSLYSNCLLVDSLGTWVANLLLSDGDTWDSISSQFLHSLDRAAGEVILVAEETGWGVVPHFKSGRLFRDRLGMLSRQIGAIADTVYLVTGGHVLNLSVLGKPLPGQQ